MIEELKRYSGGIDSLSQNLAILQERKLNIFLDCFTLSMHKCILIPLCDENGRIGFASVKSGELVIDPIYDKVKGVFEDENSLVAVHVNNTWGAINCKGEVVLPFKYVDLEAPINGYGLFAAQVTEPGYGNIWGVIDTSGNQVLPFDKKFSNIEGFDGGLCRVSIKNGLNTKRGVINCKGKYVISPDKYYDVLSIYNKGFSSVGIITYRDSKQIKYISKAELLKEQGYDY